MYQARILDQHELIDELVSEIAQNVFVKHPEILETFGEKGRSQTFSDLQKHFLHLQTAYKLQAPELFMDHVKWLHNVLVSREIDTRVVLTGLSIMKECVKKLSPEKAAFYRECISEAVQWIDEHLPS
ncbi:hypothetical protein FZC78_17970 [Rossellomorea vietnamensis]|uniref:Uncharacterized protein n=1 Tax=Rossellomorea vietnamensis TaxID=218284 RepID=A0A5D4NLC6_9BACI|nr:hypothetical protein [Rossellomorea vietnamensis]TYS14690.1 hypothetical protein FZC78_17970 [Rossellomorea vietnamensis]